METVGAISLVILSCLILIDISRALFNKDRSIIWSPVTFVIVCILYYIYLPYFRAYELIEPSTHGNMLFSTLLYYLSFKVAFAIAQPKHRFERLNNLIEEEHTLRIAFLLFVLPLFLYFAINGFSLSFINTIDDIRVFDENASYYHPEQYLTNLIACFCLSGSLAYVAKNKIDWRAILMISISVIIYIIDGFRYRLLLLFISFFTVYHLFPYPRKINYKIVIPLFIALYLLVGLIEQTRVYGFGMDANMLKDVITGNVERQEAKENVRVYTYSAKVIEESSVDDLIYFKPLATAALMPIPRSLFPWKPKGEYTREISWRVLGNISEGQAFCTIVEGYLSFGWFGIILYGFLLGWLAKLFWLNYLDNQEKIGAILLLALFNAMIYVIFSRGYLAQAFTQFMYYVFIPFWLVMLLKKIKVVK